MNLQTHIPTPLWDAVSSAYLAGNYSHAVLEATHFISGVLRDKAGVDGDGSALVGQALGGETPKLRVNGLQTESEKNVQRGLEQILRGVYIGIRNPRSHDPIEDTREVADAIIHFLGYLASILNASKDTFTVTSFLQKVQEPEFVASKRYAELIVAEIPSLKLGEALNALFKVRKQLNFKNVKYLIATLRASVNANQKVSFLSLVSEEFRSISEAFEIRTALQMLTPEWWQDIQELPRLRIENKLISGIRDGDLPKSGKTNENQALATWSNNFLGSFSLKSEAASALLGRLEGTKEERAYVSKFFFSHLKDVIEGKYHTLRLVRALHDAIVDEDQEIRTSLIYYVDSFPLDFQKKLAEFLANFTDPENPAVKLSDGSPFLSAPPKTAFDEMDDDIPF